MGFLSWLGAESQQDGPQGTGAYRTAADAFKAAPMVRQAQGAQATDPTQSNQSRGYLTTLAGQLQDQAAGRAPSMAGLQLQQGNEQAQRQFLGALAAQRGMNPGAAATLAANQAAQGAQATNATAAQAAIAERNAAQGLLGQVGGELRSGDLGQQQLGQQLNLANMQNSQFNAGQFNAALGADTQAQNQLAAQQNAEIAAIERQRQQANAQLRNEFLMKLAAAGLSGASAGLGGGAVGGAGAALPAAAA